MTLLSLKTAGVEPVINRPDPFGGAERGVSMLEPGEALSVGMAIAVAPAQ